MTRDKLTSLIEDYIHKKVQGASEKKHLQKLFLSGGRQSFLSLWEEYDGDYNTAVRESVKSCKSDKDKIVQRYKGLIEYLNKNSDEDILVDWPPVDISSRIDRIIYIMKVLQTNPQNAVEFLSDKLWMSTRTIESDLSSIQPETMKEPLSFLDQSFVINGIHRANGSVEFLSSVHPMLLMENLMSVVVLFEAMLEKAQSPNYHDWVMITAGHAWNQLTEYAQVRVEEVLRKTYDEDSLVLHIFDELKAMPADGLFHPEEEIARDAINKVMFGLKMSRKCVIFCEEQDGTPSVHIGRPVHISDSDIDDEISIRLDDDSYETFLLKTVKKCEYLKN